MGFPGPAINLLVGQATFLVTSAKMVSSSPKLSTVRILLELVAILRSCAISTESPMPMASIMTPVALRLLASGSVLLCSSVGMPSVIRRASLPTPGRASLNTWVLATRKASAILVVPSWYGMASMARSTLLLSLVWLNWNWRLAVLLKTTMPTRMSFGPMVSRLTIFLRKVFRTCQLGSPMEPELSTKNTSSAAELNGHARKKEVK